MSKRPATGKFWWSLLAGFGLAVPGVILNLRARVMCPHLELKAFDFLPLAGVVHGYNPHLLYRIMHDLTHPIFLAAYAVVMSYLAIRPMTRPVDQTPGWFHDALLLVHLAVLGGYFGSMFLPIGDMVEVIAP